MTSPSSARDRPVSRRRLCAHRRGCRCSCSISAPSAVRPALRRASRIISAFRPASPGMALAGRAFNQALKFGAEIAIPLEVARLDCGEPGQKPGDAFAPAAHQWRRGARPDRRRSRPAPATAGPPIPNLAPSRAGAFPIGHRRSRRSFARARRLRWWAGAIRPDRPWCFSRRK